MERPGADPPHPGSAEGSSTGGGSPTDDALRRLEHRLDRASDAAERLLAEAASSAARAAGSGPESPGSEAPPRSEPPQQTEPPPRTGPPPSGWQAPGDRAPDPSRGDLELLMQFVQSVRDLIPPELQRRLADALRELLLALRALIDWYLERSAQRRTGPSEVQDIPIQ